MKRLGALLLVLVLTMSVMPMGALADNSEVFLTWATSTGNVASMNVPNGSTSNGVWSEATTTNSFRGLAVKAPATIDADLTVSYLALDNAVPLTVSPANGGLGWLTVQEGVKFCSETTAGSIVVQNGGKLTVGSTVFETSGTGKITITVSTTNASVTSASITDGATPTSLLEGGTVTATDFIIDITGGPVTITSLIQAADDVSISNVAPASVTFMGTNELNGEVNLKGDVIIGSGAYLKLNPATFTSLTNPAQTVTVKGTLEIASKSDLDGKFDVNGGTIDIKEVATFASVVDVRNNGEIIVGSNTDFEGEVSINSGGKIEVNVEGTGASFSSIEVQNGTLNLIKNAGANATLGNVTLLAGGVMDLNGTGIINTASVAKITLNGGTLNVHYTNDLPGSKIAFTSGNMFVNVNTSITNADLIVGAGGTLKVKDGVKLDLNDQDLIVEGKADFGTGGFLEDTTGVANTVTVTGALYMKDPAVQVLASLAASNFRGAGTIHTDHRTWFIRGYADPDLKYVGYSPLAISYGESILVNTPVLAPASSNYSGYGDFIINTSGLFSNFDPNESLYANNQKLQVGVDYEVNDKGGYAIFTIYESFMQSQSGPIVFRATFKNGYSGSTTVNAQSAVIPAEIGVDAPKTGMSASAMGFVVIAMAIALAVVVRKVKA